MTFEVNEKLQKEHFVNAMMGDLALGLVTLFAVTCVGSDEEPHASHGGYIVDDQDQALRVAREANEDAAKKGAKCRYLPTVLGVEPEYILKLGNKLVLGDAGEAPNGE